MTSTGGLDRPHSTSAAGFHNSSDQAAAIGCMRRQLTQLPRVSNAVRQRSGDLAFARVTAEIPGAERGTWFDTCPGRGAKSERVADDIPALYGFSRWCCGCARQRHDLTTAVATGGVPVELRRASSSARPGATPVD